MELSPLPKYATITTENLINDLGGTILSVTSQASLFPKERLLDPRRSVTWRSTSAGAQQIVGQFASSSLPAIFALINSNLASGQTVTLELASNQAISSNVLTWNFTTYAQDWDPIYLRGRHTLRWYLGIPDSGGTASDRPFFRITLPASGTIDSDGDGVADSYHELGVIYLGMFSLIPNSLGRRIRVIDPSRIALSDGGARFPDVRPPFHEIDMEAPLLTHSSSMALRQMIEAAGSHRHVLYDEWARSSDPSDKAKGCRYGFLGGGRDVAGTFTRRWQTFDTADLVFVEATA